MGTMTTAFATTVTKDGIEASVETDKESYTAGEEVKVTVMVKNTGAETVGNITVELKVPDGLKLADGQSSTIYMVY